MSIYGQPSIILLGITDIITASIKGQVFKGNFHKRLDVNIIPIQIKNA
jgi:hypothetical protein